MKHQVGGLMWALVKRWCGTTVVEFCREDWCLCGIVLLLMLLLRLLLLCCCCFCCCCCTATATLLLLLRYYRCLCCCTAGAIALLLHCCCCCTAARNQREKWMEDWSSTREEGKKNGELDVVLWCLRKKIEEKDERLLMIENTKRENEDEREDYMQENFASNLHSFVFLERKEEKR